MCRENVVKFSTLVIFFSNENFDLISFNLLFFFNPKEDILETIPDLI